MIPCYDKLYSFKDYSAEVKTVLSMCDYPERVLDVGCGTGEHAMIFSKNSLVVGTDIDLESIEYAQGKTNTDNPLFLCTEISELSVVNKFDLVVSLFNVINYIDNLEELIIFFRSIKNLMNPNSSFIFDCWNGLAAILDNPKNKVKKMIIDGVLIRNSILAETSLFEQSVKISSFVSMNKETFTYFYNQTLWTPRQLKEVLEMVGFETIKITEWMNPDIIATEKSWKIMVKCE